VPGDLRIIDLGDFQTMKYRIFRGKVVPSSSKPNGDIPWQTGKESQIVVFS
jgi:hypothetical protein